MKTERQMSPQEAAIIAATIDAKRINSAEFDELREQIFAALGIKTIKPKEEPKQ